MENHESKKNFESEFPFYSRIFVKTAADPIYESHQTRAFFESLTKIEIIYLGFFMLFLYNLVYKSIFVSTAQIFMYECFLLCTQI